MRRIENATAAPRARRAVADAQTSTGPATPVAHRGIITVCVIGATLVQALDQTIANVALPYMQGSFSASFDEITWVLTSYIIAAAIMTAPVGWLAARFGRKRLFVTALAGFTVTSMMCGAAQTLTQIVTFRLLQGMCGAALVPLSQATMLDIYPPEKRAFAMAIWGMGVMIGPILGPTLGGYLTDFYNWRYVFYVNLPFGLFATLGLILFMPGGRGHSALRFDWIGFAALGIGIGSLQLMLDRGQELDWFGSREIVVEAVLAGLGLYLFVVHVLSAKRPLIRPSLFRDVNFAAGAVMMFAVGTILVSTMSLMAPWLQELGGYPVATAGLVMAPRGIGNLATIVLSGRLAQRIDARLLVGVGLVLMIWSFWIMTGWTPDVSPEVLIAAIVIQGAGLGLFFTPLQVLAFATLPVALRTEGASMFALFRNIGAAIGVSVTASLLAHNAQGLHAMIGASVTPFNRALAAVPLWNPATRRGAALLADEITRQSQIIAYMDDYKLLIFTTMPSLLLLLLMRRPRGSQPAPSGTVAMD